MPDQLNVSQEIVEVVSTIVPSVVVSQAEIEVVQGFLYNYVNLSQMTIEVLMAVPTPIITVQEM